MKLTTKNPEWPLANPRYLAFWVCIFLILTGATLTFLVQSIPNNQINLAKILLPPSAQHLLGTDVLGRDLLGRLMAAFYTAILPLWITLTASCILGAGLAVVHLTHFKTSLKSPSGLARVIELLASTVSAIPIILAVFLWAIFYRQAGITSVAQSLGILVGTRSFILVLELYNRDSKLAFWEAHHSFGGSISSRIWRYGISQRWRQDLTNTLIFYLQAAVLVETALSYLGFGVTEPQPSFGNIIASHFDEFLRGQWFVLGSVSVFVMASLYAPFLAYKMVTSKRQII